MAQGRKLMALTNKYRRATRYGLTRVEPSERLRAAGWRQVWRHPSGAVAMRHPCSGYWVVSMDAGATIVDEGFSSSLRAAAGRIERLRTARSR